MTTEELLAHMDGQIVVLDERRAALVEARATFARAFGLDAAEVAPPAPRKHKPGPKPKTRVPKPSRAGEVLGVVDELKGKVLKLLEKRQGLSPKDCREATGGSSSSMKQAIEQLAKERAIVVVGRHRAQKVYAPGKAPKEEL